MNFFERGCLNFGERWNIRLPDSEDALRQTIRRIERSKNTEQCCRDVHNNQCDRAIEDLQQAYRLRETSIAMLQDARASQDQTRWNHAYNAADAADKAIISYLKGSVQGQIMLRNFLITLIGCATLEISLLATKHDAPLALLSTVIFGVSSLIPPQLVFCCYSERITSKFVPQLTQNVLDAARQEGIDLDLQALETAVHNEDDFNQEAIGYV